MGPFQILGSLHDSHDESEKKRLVARIQGVDLTALSWAWCAIIGTLGVFLSRRNARKVTDSWMRSGIVPARHRAKIEVSATIAIVVIGLWFIYLGVVHLVR